MTIIGRLWHSLISLVSSIAWIVGEMPGQSNVKKMFSVFHESGIFLATCRHCFVLLACGMIKSEELCVRPCVNIMEADLSLQGKISIGDR
jgi:hypothetical protein